jgi:short-subunit dehydrogenase involved in D-alanine esterification of teichoic acids
LKEKKQITSHLKMIGAKNKAATILIIISSFAFVFFSLTGLYNATKTLAFASYFCKMRVKILYK